MSNQIVVTGKPNGGGSYSINYGTHENWREFASTVQESYPDDQLWDRIPGDHTATTEQLVETAIAILESADACEVRTTLVDNA